MCDDNKFIIEILEFGTFENYRNLRDSYSKEEIRNAMITHPGLEAKTRNFVSCYFKIPINVIKSNGLVERYEMNSRLANLRPVLKSSDKSEKFDPI
jgi:hypothetical protein